MLTTVLLSFHGFHLYTFTPMSLLYKSNNLSLQKESNTMILKFFGVTDLWGSPQNNVYKIYNIIHYIIYTDIINTQYIHITYTRYVYNI